MNGNCLYFMSCRKLAGEPNRRLSWKKKWFLFCAVYLLFRKIRCVIFPWDWVRKKKTCSNIGIKVWTAHQVRPFSVFPMLNSSQRPSAQTERWQKGGWAIQGWGGPGRGILGQCSWPGEDPTWELFGWQKGAAVLKNGDFSSRQYSGMHFSGSQHSYFNENLVKLFNTEWL